MWVTIWIVLCILVGIWANKLNRIGFLWFLTSIILSPLLMGIILLIAGKYVSKDDLKAIYDSYTMKKDAFIHKYTSKIEINQKNTILSEIYADIRIGKKINEKTLDSALSIM